MKRLLNISLLLIAVAFLASCSNKYTIYHPSSDGVTFVSGTVQGLADAAQTPIPVSVNRAVANASMSVPLTFKSYTLEEQTVHNPETDQDEVVTVEVPNTVFTLPTTQVNFEVNEFSKELQVQYEYSSLVPGIDYYFEIGFDESIVGPAGFNNVVGNIKMKLEYQDYKTCSYDQYAYVNTDKMAFDYFDGPFVPEFAEKPVVLQLAAGTDCYYKLTFDYDMELEFKVEGGKMVIDKYDGYNDKLTLSSSQISYTVKVGSDTYRFYRAPTVLFSVTGATGGTIPSGAYFTLNHWCQKNGAYYPNSYNCYQWIDVD